MNAADYAAVERLRGGLPVHIRALRPADRAEALAAVGRTSQRSLHLRFFAPKHDFSERELELFLNVDFVSHVALTAVLDEGGQQVIAGAGRYIVSGPGRAEVAFMVDDPHQNLGIATCLMRHLVTIARDAGIKAFVAEVLAENASMLKVFKRCGLGMTTRQEAGVVHVTLDLSRDDPGAKKVQD